MWGFYKKYACYSTAKGVLSVFLAVSLVFTSTSVVYSASRGNAASVNLTLPSGDYSYPALRGIRFDPDDPLRLKFLIDTGDGKKIDPATGQKLIRYFLAGLTMPLDKMWVNLSPYEKNKVIDPQLSLTDLGIDMLSQDYLLKQISASLTYPDSPTGKKYWSAALSCGESSADSKMVSDSFTKVWIVPGEAHISQKGNAAFITRSSLKAMLEADYRAMKHNNLAHDSKAAKAMREAILPEVTRDINSGRDFAQLRQIYSALILAVWFKDTFKDSFYSSYIDSAKVKGVDLKSPSDKERVYNAYVAAFSKGVYDLSKRERGSAYSLRQRRYFSGGLGMQSLRRVTTVTFIDENADTAVKDVAGGAPVVLEAHLTDIDDDANVFAFDDGMAGAMRRPGSKPFMAEDEKRLFTAAREAALTAVREAGEYIGTEDLYGQEAYVVYGDLDMDALEYHFKSEYGWIVIVNKNLKDIKSSSRESKFLTLQDEALFYAGRSIFWSQLTSDIQGDVAPAFDPGEVNRLAWMETIVQNGYVLTPYQRWAINNLTNDEKRDVLTEDDLLRAVKYRSELLGNLRDFYKYVSSLSRSERDDNTKKRWDGILAQAQRFKLIRSDVIDAIEDVDGHFWYMVRQSLYQVRNSLEIEDALRMVREKIIPLDKDITLLINKDDPDSEHLDPVVTADDEFFVGGGSYVAIPHDTGYLLKITRVSGEMARFGISTRDRNKVFINEIEKMIRLRKEGARHEAKILGIGVTRRGEIYARMEHNDGENDIATAIRRGKLPTVERLVVALDAAYAIRELHRKGKVHRDIKPKNITRDKNDKTRLIDFGLLADIGVPNDKLGTPGYMPDINDEEFDDYKGGVTPAFDVYCFGRAIEEIFFKNQYNNDQPLASDVMPKILVLVNEMTRKKSLERITMDEVISRLKMITHIQRTEDDEFDEEAITNVLAVAVNGAHYAHVGVADTSLVPVENILGSKVKGNTGGVDFNKENFRLTVNKDKGAKHVLARRKKISGLHVVKVSVEPISKDSPITIFLGQ